VSRSDQSPVRCPSIPMSIISFLMIFLTQLAPQNSLLSSKAFSDDPAADVIAAREAAFSEQMASTVLIGSFTVDGQSDGNALKEERYEIESVVKTGDNLWTFTTRVKYGKVDTTLPITVPLQWAGDTPMVTLTKASLPGLGDEFSARVLFYENRYAGTWQHGPVGGHMFGRIEKRDAEPKAQSAQKPEPSVKKNGGK
jgi:hypothetical protein